MNLGHMEPMDLAAGAILFFFVVGLFCGWVLKSIFDLVKGIEK